MKVTPLSTRPAVRSIRDEFDRLFGDFGLPGFFGRPAAGATTAWAPSLDFSETGKEYIARVEAPGIAKDDLEVNVDGRTLTVSGHRDFAKEEKTEEYFWREREYGRFVRTVQLPGAVDASKVTATYQDGVLTVRLPKTEPTVKNRVPIG